MVLVLSQQPKTENKEEGETVLDLPRLAEDMFGFASDLERKVKSKSDDELMDLEDDTARMKDAIIAIEVVVMKELQTRNPPWLTYMRTISEYPDLYKPSDISALIKWVHPAKALTADSACPTKLHNWSGFYFQLWEDDKVYTLRVFDGDGSRDVVCEEEGSMKSTPKAFQFRGTFAERGDIEDLAKDSQCSVYNFLKAQTGAKIQDIVAFHFI